MRSEKINCDCCSALKGAANRWLMGWQSEHGYALGDWENGLEYRLSRPVQHFCGEKCALQYQAKFLRM